MKNLTQLPGSGKGSKAKTNNTSGHAHAFTLILTLLLTLGVGQMWGWNFSGDNFIYFHNKGSWTDSGKMLFIGKSNYSSVYTMSAVTGNSSLWVVKITNAGWSDATYMAVAGGSNVWGSGSWGPSNRTNATHYTNTYTSGVDASNNQRYMLTPASGSNNANLSLAYLGTGEPNYTITVKAKVSTNGGSSYSEATSPGTLSASSKKFTSFNSCNSTTSLSSGTITCGYYATTTLTAADATGYDFVGWYNSSGTQQTTDKTLTIYPTANATYYAYYKEKQYSLTFSHNGHGSIAVGGNTISSGSTANVNYTTTKTLVATPNTGYDFSGWTKSGSNTGSVTIGNASNASTTIKATKTGATITAGFTPKTTTITLNNADATTAGTTEVTATYDATIPTITIPTKTGYTFGGYWGAPGGTGPKYINADGTGNGTWQNEESTYTLYAAWAENKSTVTLVASPSGKGTFQVGGETVTSTLAGVATTPAVTAVPIAGYSFDGWSITGGASISSTTDNPTTVTGGGAGTAATLTATFVEDITYYKLKFGTRSGETYNGSVAAKDGSDNPLTSNTEYLSGTSVTVTATPADDYKFDSWYHGWSTGSSFSTVNPLTFTLSEATNVYAHFVQKTTSITLNKNGGSGGTAGPVTATHGSTTLSTNPLVKPAKSNYTFTGYWTESSGGTKVIDADGTLVASVSGYTKSGNKQWDYDDPTLTLYAQYSENKSTVTVTANETSWGTLKFASTSKSWGSTASVGVATSQNITATASSGYVFHNWELSGGATTSSDLTGTTITLKGTGSGETGTAKANFGVLSGWNMEGEDFGGWSRPSTYKFTYPYRGMSGVYYIPTTLTANRWWKVNNGSTPYSAGNSSTTVAKGTIYNLVEEWSNSCKVSSTLSNVWVVINTNDTKKIWVQDPQTFYNVNVSGANDAKGPVAVTLKTTSAFTKESNTFTTTQFASGETFTVSVTGVSGWIPTITIGGVSTTFWKEQATYTADGTMSTSDIAVTISYTASRAITFAKTTGCATLSATGPSSTAVTTGTKIKDGTSITFAQTASTGYNFSKWYSNETGTSGTQYATTSSYSLTVSSTAYTIYPIYTAKDYTVTLDVDEPNKGSIDGAATSHTVYYNTVVTDISPLPTAAAGCGLDGFYTSPDGVGTKLFNGDGSCIASVDGYTDGDTKWIRDGGVALYAYYKQAEITELTFVNAIVAQSVTNGVKVTPTISPTPTGTTHIDWRVLYSNGNPLASQPSMTAYNTTGVQFTSPATSGTYLVEAVLRTGSTPNAGTRLDSTTASFQVAGTHKVTLQYKCGSDAIAASTEMTARPLAWSDQISAPDIFGYTFTRWDAGDGVTITDDDGETTVTTSTSANIKVKATYDGRLTAVYTQKSLIYFKNTLNWSSVYVNFYGDNYWGYNSDANKGSGNNGITDSNKAMTRIGETDVWYYDYGAASITPSMYVSFTEDSQNNYQYFWKASPGENVVYPSRYTDTPTSEKVSEGGFKPATPMFVPIATQTPLVQNEQNSGWANYYNAGYWTKYTEGTGYTLEIYNSTGNSLIKSASFTSSDELMPMSATVDLDASTTYKFQLRRGGTGDDGVYYGNSGTMTYANHGQTTAWDMTNHPSFTMCGITTNASGAYTFKLSYAAASNAYRLRMAVDYPVASGDYRVIYKDNVHTLWHHSAIVPKVNNGKDTVSFFIRPGSSPQMKIQQSTVNASTGAVTWNDNVTVATATLTALAKDSVYNVNLKMDGSGNISVENITVYTGNFYIRTDCANSKWDNYRSDPDHLMTYSDYSENKAGYSHYYTHWVDCSETGRKNVKFCIANDYSPSISDTLIRETASGAWANIGNYITTGGDLQRNANVRFMWNRHTNAISRAYVDGAQENNSHFLQILSADSKIKNKAGDAVLTEVTFTDNGNWLYEANIKAQPNAQIKLKSTWGETNTIEQYFKGTSSSTATLIGGSSSDWYDIRLIYDFKTNRLVTAYLPSGTLSEDLAIHADIMFLREHQGDVTEIDFTGGAKITDIETVYSVLQFNKWTLNNRSKTGTHALLSPQLSRYERDMFYVSFPFDVKASDIIGFGTYGKHWIIEYYDGAARAANGFWADSPTFWKFVTPAMKNSFTLKAGTGYIVALDLDELWYTDAETHASVWDNTDVVELLFPGSVTSISSTSVTYNIPEHTCNIGPRFEGGDDRTIKDSHWNVLGVPTYHNLDDGVGVSAANTTWTAAHPKYIYTWNMQDNTLTATSATGFDYQAMHAYVVQYCGNITFTTSASPAPVVARRTQGAAKEIEFRLALQQNNADVDQTFVRMSNDEEVSAGFEFGEDMSKEFNKGKANIYTMISSVIDNEASVTEAAGNVLPMSEQTTVVPVGVKVVTNDDYTFSIPEGTDGVGVTLIDTETGIRTVLSAVDYTVSLEAGTYDNRFVLEISPIRNMPTELETSDNDAAINGVRKLLINGLLYIVRDGKVYDARGARVE